MFQPVTKDHTFMIRTEIEIIKEELQKKLKEVEEEKEIVAKEKRMVAVEKNEIAAKCKAFEIAIKKLSAEITSITNSLKDFKL